LQAFVCIIGGDRMAKEGRNTVFDSTVNTFAMAIESKDPITHGHSRRVQTYAVELAKRLGVTDQSLVQAIDAAARLHDIGKIAVPEYILNKTGNAQSQ
jgi:HD-GYP domain-containing protein (c-di-GMP phosphodiesterase class II)